MRLLLIVAIVAFAAFGLNAAEVAGTWKGAMETPMGKVDVTGTQGDTCSLSLARQISRGRVRPAHRKRIHNEKIPDRLIED